MVVLTRPEGTLPEDLHISRRGFAALIAAGYAAAATGADAAPITTRSDGLIIENITMPGGLPGYVARPAAKGRHPAIIVVNEVFGVHEWIKDICRRFAQLGYVAIAPGFFFRNDPEQHAGQPDRLQGHHADRRRSEERPGHGRCRHHHRLARKAALRPPKRLAITGFCWGGTVVWMAAAKFPQLKAGGAWYGRLKPPPPPPSSGNIPSTSPAR